MATLKRLTAKRQPDTAEDIAWRVRMAQAGEQAHAEAVAKFGEFTAENIGAALKFQEARIRELMQSR